MSKVDNKKFSLQDIKNKYKDFKRGKGCELSYLLGHYKLEMALTILFLKLNISANKITLISMGFGVLGCILIMIGYPYTVIGGVSLVIWALLDYVDGNVARLSNSVSNIGRYLDLINSHLVGPLTYVSLGFVTKDPRLFPFLHSIINVPGSSLGLIIAVIYLSKRVIKSYAILLGLYKHHDTPTSIKSKIYFYTGSLFEFPRLYTIIVLVIIFVDALYEWLLLLLLAQFTSLMVEALNIIKSSFHTTSR